MKSIRALDKLLLPLLTLVAIMATSVFSVTTAFATDSAKWTGESSFQFSNGSSTATFESVGTFNSGSDYELFAKDGNIPSVGESCDDGGGAILLAIKVGDTKGTLYNPASTAIGNKVSEGGALTSCMYKVDAPYGVTVTGTRPTGSTPKEGALTEDYIEGELFAQCSELDTKDNKKILLNFGKKRADAVIDLYTGATDELKDKDYDRCATLAAYLKNPKWLDGDLTAHLVLTEGGAEESTTTCALQGIGWMICPVVRTIAVFNDSLFALLENLLSIDARMFDTSQAGGKAVFQSWKAIRDISNIAFVIAFMIIVYSQITSVGISNYGIKKMLPRIVIAAILVNLSFFICAIAVDISNIIGSSLHELMISSTKALGDDTGANLQFWDKTTAWLLAGGTGALAIGAGALTIGTYGFLGALALLIPLAVMALVAALTVVFVLIARQALVIILIVISPLAFVAYLLPNTEQWFGRWRKTFTSMLLIYPLVALLFGGSQLASAVIRSGADDALVFILSLIVLVMPLFATPLLLKFSGGLIGRVAGMMNNPNKGPFDRLKKGGANFANRRRGYKAEGNFERTKNLREGVTGAKLGRVGSRRRRAASWLSGIGNENAVNAEQQNQWAEQSKKAAERSYFADRAKNDIDYATKIGGGPGNVTLVQAYGTQAQKEERIKDIKAGTALIDHLDNASVAAIAKSGKDKNGAWVSSEVFAAATHRIQETGSFKERRESLEFMAANKTGATSERLGMDSTLRGEAAQKAIARGDSKIYGAGFANELIKEGGSIRDASSLAQAAVTNAAAGALNGEHLTQGDASTEYLVKEIMASGDTAAQDKLRLAADSARTQTSTASKVTGKIDIALQAAGSTKVTATGGSAGAPTIIVPGAPGYSPTGGGASTTSSGGPANPPTSP